MNDRSLGNLFIGSTVLHEIQHYGSKNNQKIISGASTNYNCHYNSQLKTNTPSKCMSSPLYSHCQKHMEEKTMKTPGGFSGLAPTLKNN